VFGEGVFEIGVLVVWFVLGVEGAAFKVTKFPRPEYGIHTKFPDLSRTSISTISFAPTFRIRNTQLASKFRGSWVCTTVTTGLVGILVFTGVL
jgi:hypothetical protein